MTWFFGWNLCLPVFRHHLLWTLKAIHFSEHPITMFISTKLNARWLLLAFSKFNFDLTNVSSTLKDALQHKLAELLKAWDTHQNQLTNPKPKEARLLFLEDFKAADMQLCTIHFVRCSRQRDYIWGWFVVRWQFVTKASLSSSSV